MSLNPGIIDSSYPMIDPERLRNLATQKARSIHVETPPNESPEHIIQELRIHQIELEMQNEELERSQAALGDAKNHYANLFDRAPIAYVELDAERNVNKVNIAARGLFEMGPEDMSNRFFQKFFSDRNRGLLQECLDKVSSSVNQVRSRLQIETGAGKTKYIEASIARMQDGGSGQDIFLCGFLDFTKEHEFQEKLTSSEKQLKIHVKERQTMFDALPAHVALLNKDGIIQAVNVAWKRFAEANGLNSSTFNIGDNYMQVCETAHGECSEEAARVAQGLRSVLQGEVSAFTLEYPCHSPKEERWFRLTITAVEAGKREGAVVMHVDISQERQMHLQSLRSQRLESIGTLAAGIAHDLNNVLTPIVMGADLIESNHLDSTEREVLETISSNARRGADMIRQLLDYARGAKGLDKKTIQPMDVIQEVQSIIRESFPKNIQFTMTGETDLSLIKGNSTQLHQAILNLCLNARDAMKFGGTLNIHTENCHLREGDGILPPDISPGAFVKIQISDTGHGIPKLIQDRIYDPFYTTKPFGEGTGLGLSTTLGIVQSNSGFIHLRSRLEEGSVFSVYLPTTFRPAIMSAAPTENKELETIQSSKSSRKRILVVDDESSIRTLLQKTLDKLNYESLAASTGAEAISIFVENSSNIDLTITDAMMPIMDGNDLIKTFKKINPDHKIIAISGVDSETALTEEARQLVDVFISKPFHQAQLKEAIKKLLEE
jgi:two-component system, cell cycle sensor histidine kinase and response regulator CckA